MRPDIAGGRPPLRRRLVAATRSWWPLTPCGLKRGRLIALADQPRCCSRSPNSAITPGPLPLAQTDHAVEVLRGDQPRRPELCMALNDNTVPGGARQHDVVSAPDDAAIDRRDPGLWRRGLGARRMATWTPSPLICRRPQHRAYRRCRSVPVLAGVAGYAREISRFCLRPLAEGADGRDRRADRRALPQWYPRIEVGRLALGNGSWSPSGRWRLRIFSRRKA